MVLMLVGAVGVAIGGCDSPVPARSLLKVVGELVGREHQTYTVAIPASGFLTCVLAKAGHGMELSLRNSNGVTLAKFESGTGRYGQERAVFEIKNPQTISIVVTSKERSELSGRFRLEVELVPSVASGERAFSDASNSAAVLTRSDRALLFERAAAEFSKDHRVREAGLALLAAGASVDRLETDPARAQQLIDAAVLRFNEDPQSALLAGALLLAVRVELGRPGGSSQSSADIVNKLDQAERIFTAINDRGGIGLVMTSRGAVAYLDRDNGTAVAHWLMAIEHCSAVREYVCLAGVYQNLGANYRDDGRYGLALRSLLQARNSISASDDPQLYADIDGNIGYTYRMMGDYDAALAHHLMALREYSAIGRCSKVSAQLYAMGYALLGIGEVQQAIQAYALVLEGACHDTLLEGHPAVDGELDESTTALLSRIEQLCTATSTRQPNSYEVQLNMLWTAWDMGNLARQIGNGQAAVVCHKLALQRAPTDNTRIGLRIELADDALLNGKASHANADLQAVIVALVNSPAANTARDYYLARARLVSGKIFMALGKRDAAKADLSAAIQLFAGLDDLDGRFSASVALADNATNPSEVATRYADADTQLDLIRTLSADPTYRAGLLDSRRKMYAHWVRSALTPHSPENPAADTPRERYRALAISERSRARVVSEIVSGIESEGVRTAIATQALLDAAASGQLKPADVSDQPKSELPNGNPSRLGQRRQNRYDMSAAIAGIKRYQRSLPDSVAVLEYLLGETETYAWVLTRDAIAMTRLAPAAEIRRASVRLARQLRANRSDTDLTADLEQAYDLLIRPVQFHIGTKDLLIVADDALHEVPFSALRDRESGRYLVQQRATAFVPSILFVSERAAPIRGNALKKMLLVGDPVYDKRDVSLRCGLAVNKHEDSIAGKPAIAKLPRLFGSAKELQSIRTTVAAQKIELLELTACAANRHRVLSQPLDQYAVLHFALHATSDPVVPQRSAIHLSPVDELGRDQPESIIVADLLGRRTAAQLVVLSGCETAAGRVFSGDGTLGLTFAMLAVGSETVVSTLWPAADSASAQMMQFFYQGVIAAEQPIPQALRAAQLQLLAIKRWQSPRFWATYVVVGDYRNKKGLDL